MAREENAAREENTAREENAARKGNAVREENAPKIGAGHASAMFRQGLAELRGAIYPGSNVAQPAQYGLYGVATPQEVVQEKRGESRDPRKQQSILDERLKQADQQREADREPEPPQPEKD